MRGCDHRELHQGAARMDSPCTPCTLVLCAPDGDTSTPLPRAPPELLQPQCAALLHARRSARSPARPWRLRPSLLPAPSPALARASLSPSPRARATKQRAQPAAVGHLRNSSLGGRAVPRHGLRATQTDTVMCCVGVIGVGACGCLALHPAVPINKPKQMQPASGAPMHFYCALPGGALNYSQPLRTYEEHHCAHGSSGSPKNYVGVVVAVSVSVRARARWMSESVWARVAGPSRLGKKMRSGSDAATLSILWPLLFDTHISSVRSAIQSAADWGCSDDTSIDAFDTAGLRRTCARLLVAWPHVTHLWRAAFCCYKATRC